MESYKPLVPARPLPDQRLLNRLDTLLDCFSARPDCTIPEATGDRNAMDTAYDFFKNPRVSPGGIVTSCLPYTLANLQGCCRVLAIEDCSDLNYAALDDTADLGYTDGHDTRGLKLHSTLAVRDDGLVAGLLTQQVWSRPFSQKGRAAKRRLRNAKDKESYRWQDHARTACSALPASMVVIHVADREGDIYDWFAAPRAANAHLLVRVAQSQRIVVHGTDGAEAKLAEVVAAQAALGKHPLTVPRADDRPARQAELTIRVAAMDIQPPRNAKQRSRLAAVPVWVVEAREEQPPAGAKAIHWRLVSTEAITTWEEVVRALREYVLRWLIERFHFVLKCGFQVEQLQLEAASRLANAVAVYSQAAVRLMRLTYLARVEPAAAASQEFSEEELEVLQAERDRRAKGELGPVRSISEAVRVVARLGGHLGRKGDGPPGLKVLWRGLKALHHMVLGFRHGNSAPRTSSN
jgi:Transposase DNA-binding/Transposase Tn5 dimerisation domain